MFLPIVMVYIHSYLFPLDIILGVIECIIRNNDDDEDGGGHFFFQGSAFAFQHKKITKDIRCVWQYGDDQRKEEEERGPEVLKQ